MFAIISNCIVENDTEELKRIIELIKSNENLIESEAMANTILQACVANKDIENMIEIELLECLDAYIHEVSGNIALSKSIVDKYADSSLDYSPKFVRNCLIKTMYSSGYSLEDIMYITGIEFNNISKLITEEEMLQHRSKKIN